MATKQENIDLERFQINQLRQYVSVLRALPDPILEAMIDLGILQPSTILEHALSETGGYPVVGFDTNDLGDACDSDAKLVSVRLSDKDTRYSACVSGIHNKIGSLRVMVTDRIHQRCYYFHIPRSAYSYIKASTQCIEIPFELSGAPKRKSNSRVNWWDYEEPSFQDLATHMLDPKSRRALANQARLENMFPTVDTFKKTQSGGKVRGKLSMTANAIRKRAARAAKREA